uniref:Uncharacterized protein n=1 Tax=Moniliophthora roreri TaxID=221103 RepID=A0A0W0EW75_MONRR
MKAITNFVRRTKKKKATPSPSNLATAIHNIVRRLRCISGLEHDHEAHIEEANGWSNAERAEEPCSAPSADTSTKFEAGKAKLRDEERGLGTQKPLSLSDSVSDWGSAISTRGTICLDCGTLIIPYSDSDPDGARPAHYLPHLHLQPSGSKSRSAILQFSWTSFVGMPSAFIGMRDDGEWVFAPLSVSGRCDELELEHDMADLGTFTWLTQVKEWPLCEPEFLVERVDEGSVVPSEESAGTTSSSSPIQTKVEAAELDTEAITYLDGQAMIAEWDVYVDGESLSR